MDFDSAYIDPLTDDWLAFIHDKIKEQEQIILENKKFLVPYIGLHVNIVKMIFSIVDEFDLEPNAKYLALHLYDKYMNNISWEAYKIAIKNGLSEDLWEQEQKKSSNEAKLRLLSCIQLASKMDSNVKCLGIVEVQNVLRKVDPGREYSKRTIFLSEIHVYKTVEFEMPQCTPKDCVDICLAATGLRNSPGILDTSIHLLDISYLCHEELYSYLKMMLDDNFSKTYSEHKSIMIIESNALFLGAAITLCSVFLITLERKDSKMLVKKLASLAGVKDEDIWDMANLLFNISLQE